jgi:hypothetical protein
VAIDWRSRLSACPAEGIVISLDQNTPASLIPGVLANARPYEGTHIVVFCDRVRQTAEPGTELHLLAYVFVHEIAHILQGISRHSDSGIMKARWDNRDYFQMRRGSLAFAPADVDLILAALRTRNQGSLSATLVAAR